MEDDFPRNLSLLCSYHHSVAEACRRLKMNRQQFNKYLNGQSRPSRRNMRRLCDFFGVTETEILMEPSQLEQIISLRRVPDPQPQPGEASAHVEALYRHSQSLEKYVGYYYRYFYSFGNNGLITKSLVSVYRRNDRYYWKNIEIMRDPATGKVVGLSKYSGVLLYLADRIHVIEYETLDFKSLTQVTLYPSYRHQLLRLMGIQTGGPTRRGRKPGASKVALDYLGRSIDLRKALRAVGVFPPLAAALPADIPDLVMNRIEPGAYVLEVDEP
ncbi:helix-turn-helix domain-containing protein [Pseudomonas sp. GX19020]|uniref:helix-turn-helix domain-containing protein n=1 Tax=Pseudomonas sp. GX19020 TaxID=2942277 RepID=UPI00201A1E21|nr:helix-turn-helix transcriptional regulator [Pseudomonas sp. GX19020]MCL4069360.1 helix-turn-helix domain-containing protein [Pseudomonas sp. GX19020]